MQLGNQGAALRGKLVGQRKARRHLNQQGERYGGSLEVEGNRRALQKGNTGAKVLEVGIPPG
jgi:hypothetical protein